MVRIAGNGRCDMPGREMWSGARPEDITDRASAAATNAVASDPCVARLAHLVFAHSPNPPAGLGSR